MLLPRGRILVFDDDGAAPSIEEKAELFLFALTPLRDEAAAPPPPLAIEQLQSPAVLIETSEMFFLAERDRGRERER